MLPEHSSTEWLTKGSQNGAVKLTCKEKFHPKGFFIKMKYEKHVYLSAFCQPFGNIIKKYTYNLCSRRNHRAGMQKLRVF